MGNINSSVCKPCFSSVNWESKKDNLRIRYPALLDSDLTTASTGGPLLDELADKLGLSKDELHIVIMTS